MSGAQQLNSAAFVTQEPLLDVAPVKPTIRARAIRGTIWSIAGYGGQQVIRLGSSMILSRLLFPEAFGLMSLVGVFLAALQMFSDIGVGPAIIQHKRGDDECFLNTAWTMQAGRGLLLWFCAILFAWPVSLFYGKHQLLWLIPVAGISAAISGFNSTSLFTLNRRIEVHKLTILVFVCQATAALVTVVGAFFWRSVWPLVIGTLASSLMRMALSHQLLPARNHLHFDRAAAKELMALGKWIFLSTLLTFCTGQADRFIFGRIISLQLLGIYSIGLGLALLPTNITSVIGDSVIFPAFSEARGKGKPLSSVYRRTTSISLILGGAWVPILFACGPALVHLLYDRRYADAGWMIQLLALGTWFRVMQLGNGSVLLALGHPKWIAASNVVKLVGICTLIPSGYHFGGFPGAIVGLALTEIPKYGTLAVGAARHGLWALDKDFYISLAAVLAGALGYFGSTLAHSNLLRLALGISIPMLLWLPLFMYAYRLLRPPPAPAGAIAVGAVQ